MRGAADRAYHLAAAPDEDPLDPVVADLPADRPLILASLGSNHEHMLGGDTSVLE